MILVKEVYKFFSLRSNVPPGNPTKFRETNISFHISFQDVAQLLGAKSLDFVGAKGLAARFTIMNFEQNSTH